MEQIEHLKEENKVKHSIIQSLTTQYNNIFNSTPTHKSNNNNNVNNGNTINNKHNNENDNNNSNNNIDDNKYSNNLHKSNNKHPNTSNNNNINNYSNKNNNNFSSIKSVSNNSNNNNSNNNNNNNNNKTNSSNKNITINKDNLTSSSPSQNSKETVFISGYSMVKKVNGFLLTKKLKHKCIAKVRPFSSAKARCMHDNVKSTVRDFTQDYIIRHCETNELNSEKTASQIAGSIIELALSSKSKDNKISISLIVPRNNNLDNKASEVNCRLVHMCAEHGVKYENFT